MLASLHDSDEKNAFCDTLGIHFQNGKPINCCGHNLKIHAHFYDSCNVRGYINSVKINFYTHNI